MVLAVSGHLDTGKVLRVAERLFRSSGTTPARRWRRDRARRGRGASAAWSSVPFSRRRSWWATSAPRSTSRTTRPCRVLGTVSGGGMSGRLFTELRDKPRPGLLGRRAGDVRTGPTFLVTHMGTAPPNAEAAEAGVLGEIERIRAEQVSERELARAKAYLLGNLAMDRRTNARRTRGTWPSSRSRARAGISRIATRGRWRP